MSTIAPDKDVSTFINRSLDVHKVSSIVEPA